MLSVTRWTNFSEATFLLPPSDPAADYRARIFYPAGELSFAGHPTLGSCAAWLAAGGAPRAGDEVVQECGAGLIRIRRDGELLSFAAPATSCGRGAVATPDRDAVVALLGLDPADVVDCVWADNGPGGCCWSSPRRPTFSPSTYRAASGGRRLDVGLVGVHPVGAATAVEVRAFFTDATGAVREDPVTGSLNAAVAQVLLGDGTLTAPYVATQGEALGRAGRVHVDRDDDGTIWVGGRVDLRVTGEIEL